MNRILKIGLDVHSTIYTICVKEANFLYENRIITEVQVAPDYLNIVKLIGRLKQKLGNHDQYDIECGYEAGSLGYSLYHQLTGAGVRCTILAPTTMRVEKGKRIKTDKRDARLIADCLISGGYSAVYVPTETDEAVKEYIRMRDDHKKLLKGIKQQIQAFCLRHDLHSPCPPSWTVNHVRWLHQVPLPAVLRDTLTEYLISYEELTAKIARYDQKISEFAQQPEYKENVGKLTCFLGIQTITAMSLITETGDFRRFRKAEQYAAYLGLVPGEHSSAESGGRSGITKAGNKHLRRLLIEASQSASHGRIGYKSRTLHKRQEGNDPEVIAYADRANTRLRSKYYRMIRKGKKKNVAVTALARELACFVWGMMNHRLEPRVLA